MLRDGIRLYHVRHGETDWNTEGRLQGQTDIPMNENGIRQAFRNGEALLTHFLAEGIAPESLHYVASPLMRAQETMEIVRVSLGLHEDGYETEPRLIEIAFGEWSGATIRELKREGQHQLVNERRRDKYNFVPPGGESYAQLAERVAGWLAELDRDCLVSSHGGVFRVLHGFILGTPPAEVPQIPAPQNKVALFQQGMLRYI